MVELRLTMGPLQGGPQFDFKSHERWPPLERKKRQEWRWDPTWGVNIIRLKREGKGNMGLGSNARRSQKILYGGPKR